MSPHTHVGMRLLGLGGRVVMQRTATPCTPVRFRPQPPSLGSVTEVEQVCRLLEQCRDTLSRMYGGDRVCKELCHRNHLNFVACLFHVYRNSVRDN